MFLAYGDTIAISTEVGRVIATGFADPRCLVLDEDHPDKLSVAANAFHKSLFVVTPKQHYAARLELQQQRTFSRSFDATDRRNLEAYLVESERAEQQLNLGAALAVNGAPVTYGSTIQLRHVASGQFLSILPRRPSDLEKDCLKIELTSNPSEEVWFTVWPRFKMRSEGDPVHYHDQLLLGSGKWHQYLNASSHAYPAAPWVHEVTASFQPHPWRVALFAPHSPDSADGTVTAAAVVRLFHPETDTLLLGSVDTGPVLAPESAQADCRSLWTVERVAVDEGGPCEWNVALCLRHLVSGRYLARVAPDSTDICLSPERNTDLCSFIVSPTGSVFDSKQVANGVSLRLLQGKGWVHAASDGLTLADDLLDQDAFRVQVAADDELADIYFVQSALPGIQFMVNRLRSRTQPSLDEIAALTGILTDLVFFVARVSAAEGSDPLTAYGLPVPHRQRLFRDLGVFDLLFDILRLPFAADVGDPAPLYDLDTLATQHRSLFHLLKLIYRLIWQGFKENTANEMFVAQARFISTVIEQVGHELLASETLTHLLNNNRELLDGVPDSVLAMFVRLLRRSGVSSPRYIKFLTALCSCRGDGIAANQERVCAAVLQDPALANRLLIRCKRDPDDGNAVYLSWHGQDDWLKFADILRQAASPDDEDRQPLPMARVVYFFRCQILLFAELCLDRNYTAIGLLQSEYSFELVLAMMEHDNAPLVLRSAFCDLMLRLHIDRDDRKVVPSPSLTRVWNAVKTAELPCGSNPDRYLSLQHLIARYFEQLGGRQDPAARDQNLLTLAILRLLRHLVLFGFYSSLEQIEQMVAPLVKTLDGANDANSTSPVPPPDGAAIAPALKRAATTARREIEMLPLVGHRHTGDTGDGHDDDGNDGAASAAGEEPAAVGRDLAMPQRASLFDDNSPHAASDGVDEMLDIRQTDLPGRYNLDERTACLMGGKAQMCDILLQVTNLRTDFRLSQLLAVFRRTVVDGEPFETAKRDFEEIFTSAEGRRMDLDVMTHSTDLTRVLIDLVLYDDRNLANASMDLLFRSFRQRLAVLDAIGHAQLLVSDAAVSAYSTARRLIQQLRDTAETSELWCQDMASVVDKAGTLNGALEQLTHMCSFTERRDGIDGIQLLFNHGVHRAALEILRVPVPVALRSGLASVFAACFRFLALYASGAPENQIALFPHLDFFLAQAKTIPTAADAIEALFRGNLKHCWNIEESTLAQFVELTHSCGRHPRYLELLKTVITVGDRPPIRRNQNLVLKLLVEHKSETLTLFAGAAGRRELFDLMAAPDAEASALPFFIALLDLLAETARGKNVMGEAMCQSLVSLDEILPLIADSRTIPPVRDALTQYLKEVFLDTETVFHGLNTHPDLLSAFTALGDELHQTAADVASGANMARVWQAVNVTAPCVASFFEAYYSHAADQDSATLVRLVAGVLALDEALEKAIRKDRRKSTQKKSRSLEHMRAIVGVALRKMEQAGVSVPPSRLIGTFSTASDVPVSFRPGRTLSTLSQLQGGPNADPDADADADDATCEDFVLAEQLREFWLDLRSCDIVQGGILAEFGSLVRAIEQAESRYGLPFDHIVHRMLEHTRTLMRGRDPGQLAVIAFRVLTDLVNDSGCHLRMTLLGAPYVVLDAISNFTTGSVARYAQAFQFGIALLSGNSDERRRVQRVFLRLLADPDTEEVFDAVRMTLQRAVSLIKRRALEAEWTRCDGSDLFDRSRAEEEAVHRMHLSLPGYDNDYDIALDSNCGTRVLTRNPIGVRYCLRFIQLLCEDHFLAMQELMRFQGTGRKSVNLVTEVAVFVEETVQLMEQEREFELIDVVQQALETVVDLLQGPCLENQRAMAGTKLVDTCNRLLRHRFASSPDMARKGRELRMVAARATLAMLEGHSDPKIFERVAASLDIPMIGSRLLGAYRRLVSARTLRADLRVPNSEAEYEMMEEPLELWLLVRSLGEYLPGLAVQVFGEGVAGGAGGGHGGGHHGGGGGGDGHGGRGHGHGHGWDDDDGKYRSDKFAADALRYYSLRVGHVEIVREGVIASVYFRVPRMCALLSRKSKRELLWSVSRESPSEKIADFFERSEDLILEMEYRERLPSMVSLLAKNLDALKTVSFLTAVVINILVLLFLRLPTDASGQTLPRRKPEIDDSVPGLVAALNVLNAIHLIFASIFFVFYCLINGPLIVQHGWKDRAARLAKIERTQMLSMVRDYEREDIEDESRSSDVVDDRASLGEHSGALGPVRELLRRGPTAPMLRDHWHRNPLLGVTYAALSIKFLVLSPQFVFYLVYMVFSFLGATISPFFNAFHLFDLVQRNQTLRNVIRSVTNSWRQLAMTGLLGAILVYMAAAVGFVAFNADFADPDTGELTCTTLGLCFVTTLVEGLSNDGGIGGYMVTRDQDDPLYGWRVVYDLVFFIVIPTIVLNLVFGVIIDRFADLRSQKQAIEADMLNNCFVCSIDRGTFDRRAPGGFEHHVQFDHQMWSYLHFLAYLKNKPRTELSGVELYVAELTQKHDISWFPILQARILGAQHAGGVEHELRELREEVAALRRERDNKERV